PCATAIRHAASAPSGSLRQPQLAASNLGWFLLSREGSTRECAFSCAGPAAPGSDQKCRVLPGLAEPECATGLSADGVVALRVDDLPRARRRGYAQNSSQASKPRNCPRPPV